MAKRTPSQIAGRQFVIERRARKAAGLPVVVPDEGADVRRLVFDNGITSIEHVQGTRPTIKLAVTFVPYGMNDRDEPGYAEFVFRKLGYDVLAVKCDRNNWFQDVSLEEMAQVKAALPPYVKTVAYGTTMGGYGAMYFADALEASIAIAISPQMSIDPSIVPFEQRWQGDAAGIAFTHRPIVELLRETRALHHVFYDPASPDAPHVDIMCDVTNRVLPAPLLHGGHPATSFMMETGLRQSLLRKLLAGKPMDVRTAVRAARSLSPTYFHVLAIRTGEMNHPRWAAMAFERSIALDPKPETMIAYSRWLTARGASAEALTWYERAAAAGSANPDLAAFEAELRVSAGDEEGALAAFDHAIRLQPGHTALYAAEREILRRRLVEQDRRLTMLESVLSKVRAERELGTVSVPAGTGPLRVMAYVAVSILVAVLVAVVARAIGLV